MLCIIYHSSLYNFKASGEVKFLDDLPPAIGQLYAFPILTNIANATIEKVDPSKALVGIRLTLFKLFVIKQSKMCLRTNG